MKCTQITESDAEKKRGSSSISTEINCRCLSHFSHYTGLHFDIEFLLLFSIYLENQMHTCRLCTVSIVYGCKERASENEKKRQIKTEKKQKIKRKLSQNENGK